MLLPFIVSGAVFALLQFVAIPALQRQIRKDPTPSSVGKAGALSLFAYLRGLALVTCVTVGVLALGLFLLSRVGGVTIEELDASLQTVRRWHAAVLSVAPGWLIATTAVLALGLAIHAYRAGKRKMTKSLELLAQRQLDQIKTQLQNGTLPELPPDRTMKRIGKRLAELRPLLEAGAAAESSLPASARAALKSARQEAQLLSEAYLRADISRRIDIRLDADAVAPPKPETLWQKIQALFYSRSSLATIRGGSRLLYFVLLLLLVPSLLGISRPRTDAALVGKIDDLTAQRRVKQIEIQELQFRTSIEEAQQDFEAALASLPAEEETLSDEDEAAIQHLARILEDDLGDVDLFEGLADDEDSDSATTSDHYDSEGSDTFSPRYQHVLRTSSVRASILSRAAARSRGAMDFVPSTVELGHAQEGLVRAHRQVGTRRPSTRLGDVAADRLRTAARRSPPLRQRIRSYVAGFQEAATPRALRRRLFSQVADAALFGAGDTSSHLSGVLDDSPALRRRLHRAVDARVHDFATEAMRSGDFDAARQRFARPPPGRARVPAGELADIRGSLRTGRARQAVDVDDLVGSFRQHPPTTQIGSTARARLDRASPSVERFTRRLETRGIPRGQLAQCSSSVARYGDLFPGQVDLDSRTSASRLRRRYSPPSAPRVRTRSFARARSFRSLRGFARVGGVIIGRRPDAPDEVLDIRSFDYEVDGPRVRFLWSDATGVVRTSPWYRRSVVYEALAYAADGRLLAVTMTSAEPVPDLRIFVHPTLVDTPMGQRVVEIDRFVDTYAGQDFDAREEASTCVLSHLALYRMAWAERLLSVDLLAHGADEEVSQNIQSWARSVRANASAELAQLTLSGPKARLFRVWLDDPERSPLTAKEDFFHSELATWVVEAARANSTLEGFRADIARRAERRLGAHQLLALGSMDTESPVLDWVVPAPDLELWSGVREMPYALAPARVGLVDEGELEQPFQFMLQVAFTSAPGFIDGQRAEEEDQEAYDDITPWEFPGIAREIQDRVLAALDGTDGKRARRVHTDVVEFTYAHRVFRMAFEGRLGTDFPIESLERLMEECEPSAYDADQSPTPRWNWREGQYEFAVYRTLAAVLASPEGEGEEPAEGSIEARLASIRDLAFEYVMRVQAPRGADGTDRGELDDERQSFLAWREDWRERWPSEDEFTELVTTLEARTDPFDEDEVALSKAAQATLDAILVLEVREKLGVCDDWVRNRFRADPQALAPLR